MTAPGRRRTDDVDDDRANLSRDSQGGARPPRARCPPEHPSARYWGMGFAYADPRAMMRTVRSWWKSLWETDASRLREPCFVTALVLLLLNDHWWKGAALLPELVTGKLSDFCGLIVAPVLCATVVSARHPRLRWAAFSLPVVVFAAINVSADIAELWDRCLGMTGLSWHTTSDVADLVALGVLPLSAWLVIRPPQRGRPSTGLGIRLQERGLLLVSAIACVATGPIEESPRCEAYLANATQRSLDVAWRRFNGSWPCHDASIDPERLLVEEAFGERQRRSLKPLEGVALGACESRTDPAPTSGCGAALVEVEGMPTLRVSWTDLEPIVFREGSLDHQNVLWIEGVGEALGLSKVPNVEVTALEEVEPLRSCDVPDGFPVSWPGVEDGIGLATLAGIAEDDDCQLLTFEAHSPLTLCVPRQWLPFEIGESLEWGDTREWGDAGTTLTIGSQESGARVTLMAGPLELLAISAAEFEPESCDPQPTSCGGMMLPGRLRLGEHFLEPGASVTWATDRASRASLVLGRTYRVLTWPQDCEEGDTPLGVWAELLLLEPAP